MSRIRPLQGRNYGPAYSYPMGLWFTLFFVFPLAIIVVYSFLHKGVHGGVEWTVTLKDYLPLSFQNIKQLIGDIFSQFTLKAYQQMFSASYGRLFVRTLWVTFLATFFCILIALPCGYAMARSKHQTLLLFLIIIPFWTNSLIRINAWIAILGNEGFINETLKKIGLIKDSLPLLYNQRAVVLVLIYMYLPYAILPIFTSMDKFDFSLLEAARDLGASKAQSMIRILLPNVRTGIITAVIFTFIPIFGAYTVPLLVGGKDSYMIGNVIVDQVTKIRNWPLASAFSMVITVVSTIGVLWMMRSSAEDAARLKQTGKQETAV
ncbi:ABC transporter permease [Brucepastera parasyntrophica]|uniref:ABC transporter permease n=1 Tax=Brucepastera parasyntrophica TaxID=2880008 RepID=UPI00210D4F7B|nr:ABC transporter permease [Brucepastera parasyntrophica]ULQ60625.1 ABC transporter permease [Brucepastera parasyntrophica]